MSFRVQCSDHYYGPNCTTFCEPMEGVYTCDSEGVPSCLQGSQNSTTFCSQCLSSWNPSLSCAMCLDPSTNCTTCHNQTYDPSTNCTTCLGFLDPQTNCIECVLFGYDPASGCTTCLPDFIQVGNNCSRLRVESTEEVVSAVTSDYTSMHRDTLDHIGKFLA